MLRTKPVRIRRKVCLLKLLLCATTTEIHYAKNNGLRANTYMAAIFNCLHELQLLILRQRHTKVNNMCLYNNSNITKTNLDVY